MKPKSFVVTHEMEEENLPLINVNNPQETYASLR